LGDWGEARLAQIVGGGFRPRTPFKTPFGTRLPDRILDGISYEAKAGLNVGLTPAIEKQIAKDAWLVQNDILGAVEWHFWRGVKPEMLDALRVAGIRVVVH
jgi:hypothetical protein